MTTAVIKNNTAKWDKTKRYLFLIETRFNRLKHTNQSLAVKKSSMLVLIAVQYNQWKMNEIQLG